MTRKTENKWKTNLCARCNTSHINYSGKLDKNDIEYVVCGVTNKRMNVSGQGNEGHTFLFPSLWIKE